MSAGPCKIEVTTPEASNLKIRISLFAADEKMEITGSAIHEVESNPYLSSKTELQWTLQTDGHYVVTIASIEQKASDAVNGYEFPVYGSMVRLVAPFSTNTIMPNLTTRFVTAL
jgi:hypothetical protein